MADDPKTKKIGELVLKKLLEESKVAKPKGLDSVIKDLKTLKGDKELD